jgi:NADH-quinone oxidoreductase E subunit
MVIELSTKNLRELKKKLTQYPDKHSAILPILYLVQEEKGFVSLDDQREIAKLLEISTIKVKGVVDFYTMIRGEKCGKYLIQVCSTLSCSIRGSKNVIDIIKSRLKIDVGETTKDGRFTLTKVECLGSCGTAPVMQINDDYYENLTEAKIIKILDSLE